MLGIEGEYYRHYHIHTPHVRAKVFTVQNLEVVGIVVVQVGIGVRCLKWEDKRFKTKKLRKRRETEGNRVNCGGGWHLHGCDCQKEPRERFFSFSNWVFPPQNIISPT